MSPLPYLIKNVFSYFSRKYGESELVSNLVRSVLVNYFFSKAMLLIRWCTTRGVDAWQYSTSLRNEHVFHLMFVHFHRIRLSLLHLRKNVVPSNIEPLLSTIQPNENRDDFRHL